MIANGQSCSMELLGQLLEWNPYVLVLDGALDRVLMNGIKVDAVLGDYDSLNVNRVSLDLEQQINWIHTPDQDFTDFDKGIEHLIDEGYSAVNVVWATGKRLDHAHNNLLSMARFHQQINIVLLDDYSKAFVLPRSYEKFYPSGTQLSLIPITDTINIQTSGLRYPLDGEDLRVPLRTGSSNEVPEDGLVRILHDEGILCLMECIDDVY